MLTYIFVVLLALATGARRGELLALRRGNDYIRHTDGWSKVWLYPDPQFLPKTKKGLEGVVQGIPIISLQDRVDSLEPNYTLCPVRCLRYYLDRTSNVTIYKGRNSYFFPLNLKY